MMHFPSSVIAALCVFLNLQNVEGSPLESRSSYSLKETHTVPFQWTRVGAAPKDHVLNIQIGLKQSQFAELERHLYEVSDPDHVRYGQHLSADEVHDLVKPEDETLDSVHGWLQENGLELHELDYSPAKDWVKLSLPVGKLEELLQTEYSVYVHEDGTRLIRTPEWSLPKNLHDHIEVIQPTNSFLRMMPQSDLAATGISPDDVDVDVTTVPEPALLPRDADIGKVCNLTYVTPLCLRKLYGTFGYQPQVPGKNRVGLTNYLGETNNRSDVSIFLEKFRPEAAKAAYEFEIEVVNGGDNQQTPDNATQLAHYKDVEGNLDAETILGISWPTPLHAWSTAGTPPFNPDLHDPENMNEPYMIWLDYVRNEKKLPQVISNSYADDEQTTPKAYAIRVCNEFAQLGARGVTVLFGAGNFGVGKTGTCISNDGKNRTTFLPAFPASCPYVTAVGATKNFDPEVAAFDATPPIPNPKNFSTAGGFSNYFPRPAYQEDVVAPYVKSLGKLYKGLYNPNGRGLPDISAQGQRVVTVWNGKDLPLVGTSVATAVASSILTLVNDALIAQGKPPLGFLNPWLYSKGFKALTDITSGSAIGCGVDGFPAQQGWDAVTGFGTPYFPKLKNLALRTT